MGNVAVRLTDISSFISKSFIEMFENLLFLLFPKNYFDCFNFCLCSKQNMKMANVPNAELPNGRRD